MRPTPRDPNKKNTKRLANRIASISFKLSNISENVRSRGGLGDCAVPPRRINAIEPVRKSERNGMGMAGLQIGILIKLILKPKKNP